MKKIIIFSLLLIVSISIKAQEFSTEISVGYGRTCYDLEQINDGQTGFVPISISFLSKVAEGVEVGIQARANAYSPTFKQKHPYTDVKAYTQKYRGVYTTAVGRYYAPIDFPVYAQLGFGAFVGGRQKTIYTKEYLEHEPWLKDEVSKLRRETIKYRPAFAFEIQAGILTGFDENLNIFFRYSHHKNKIKDLDSDSGYKAGDIMLGIGIKF
ncbi:MAG: hypothetical protein MJ211_13025 [Bacteroidales bacterium]|nr:hypothetical protein [Bacteroidales bacterium]